MVVIVVVVGGVDNVENSEIADGACLFRHLFINVEVRIMC